MEREPLTDLGMNWDREASRIARVLISPGRIEIVLEETDIEWVESAFDILAQQRPDIVVGCPDPQ